MPRTGRPRSFNRDEALQQAMHLFWEHGYSSTSLALLKEGLAGGITATSFYAAFGSKEALFREVVQLYVSTYGRATASLFDPALRPRDAVERTLMQSARMQTEAGHPRGCLLVVAADGCSPNEMHLSRLLADERARTKEGFRVCVERAIAIGDISPITDPVSLACALQTFLLGLTSQSRDGVSLQTLTAAIATIMHTWDTCAIGPEAC